MFCSAPQVDPVDPERSRAVGLPPPAYMRNPAQLPIAKGVLQLQSQLQPAVACGGHSTLVNIIECTPPGVFVVRAASAAAVQASPGYVEELLRLRFQGVSLAAVVDLLPQAGQCGVPLPQTQQVAALLADPSQRFSWPSLRAQLLAAAYEVKESHVQLAREAVAASGGTSASEAAAPMEPETRRRTRSGAASDVPPAAKKQKETWSKQVGARADGPRWLCSTWLAWPSAMQLCRFPGCATSFTRPLPPSPLCLDRTNTTCSSWRPSVSTRPTATAARWWLTSSCWRRWGGWVRGLGGS